MSQNWAQNKIFLNLLKKKIFNFHWICSIIKTYIICCVSVHNLYLIDTLLLGHQPKCSLVIRLQYLQKNEISRTNEWNSLIFCTLRTIKIKKFLTNNFFSGNGKKWVSSIWLQDSKIECISGMNSWNKLIFCLMLQI